MKYVKFCTQVLPGNLMMSVAGVLYVRASRTRENEIPCTRFEPV